MWGSRHEMSVEEIARETGETVDAVKHLLRSGLNKLRDGRAEKFRDLMIAREKEQSHGLPAVPSELKQEFHMNGLVPRTSAYRDIKWAD